ncbi:signal peptidase I [Chloroflexota bacterium]
MKVFLRHILVTVIAAVAIFFLLQATVQSSIVVGSSMQPNFEEGQRLLVNKAVYAFHPPERGDVIIFQHGSAGKDYIKRIIGLPSEEVEIREGTVYIYKGGEVFPLDEYAYIDNPLKYTFQRNAIPVDNYFVLGDNRNNSNDSHNGWTVSRQDIIGKAWISVWPPSEWGLIPNYSYDNSE